MMVFVAVGYAQVNVSLPDRKWVGGCFFYLYDHPGLTQTPFPTGKQKPLVTPPSDPLPGLSLRVCMCVYVS